ncbi:hypothetical protein VTN96DRAFT_1290 [Rasamsonia emersonii]
MGSLRLCTRLYALGLNHLHSSTDFTFARVSERQAGKPDNLYCTCSAIFSEGGSFQPCGVESLRSSTFEGDSKPYVGNRKKKDTKEQRCVLHLGPSQVLIGSHCFDLCIGIKLREMFKIILAWVLIASRHVCSGFLIEGSFEIYGEEQSLTSRSAEALMKSTSVATGDVTAVPTGQSHFSPTASTSTIMSALTPRPSHDICRTRGPVTNCTYASCHGPGYNNSRALFVDTTGSASTRAPHILITKTASVSSQIIRPSASSSRQWNGTPTTWTSPQSIYSNGTTLTSNGFMHGVPDLPIVFITLLTLYFNSLIMK